AAADSNLVCLSVICRILGSPALRPRPLGFRAPRETVRGCGPQDARRSKNRGLNPEGSRTMEGSSQAVSPGFYLPSLARLPASVD
ncbi:hypothetical protein LEMLEM_LOCUS26343, partial [Lemmus lemmus]